MRYYIADLHFYHRKKNFRGFKNVEELNEYMIKQWNSKVKKSDEVVVLGDFSMGSYDETVNILNRLNGKIFLIKGNHDIRFVQRGKDLPKVQWVKSYAEMKDNKRNVILSHYPILFYNKAYRTENGKDITYMLCGHIHNTVEQDILDSFVVQARKTRNKTRFVPSNIINCFCEYSNYIPLSLDEWIALDKRRRRKKR